MIAVVQCTVLFVKQITSVAEPEPHHFGEAGAVTGYGSSYKNLITNTGGLLKMSQTVTVFTFPIHSYNHFNHTKILSIVTTLLFVFKKLACYIVG
jgi:hypothetical protein